MKIIVCQPDHFYFIWQLRVQMFNLRSHGIEQDAVILLGCKGSPSPEAIKFRESTSAEVLFLQDTRKTVIYSPTIVPHLMAKYFAAPSLEPFLYIGADALFIRKPVYPTGAKVYGADVRSFISSRYIKGVSETLFDLMCNESRVHRTVIEAQDRACIGAQHLFNVVPDAGFWEEMERLSERLFIIASRYNQNKFKEKRIQAWTAGMWAMLWLLWKQGIATEIHKELYFCWPTTPIEKLNNHPFFHNAGVTAKTSKDFFFKGDFRKELPGDLSYVNKNFCSAWYAAQVTEALKQN